jgi:hypothetical protein
MREDLDNHGGLLVRGDDLQVAATLREVFEVHIENALEQLRPAHSRRRAVRGFVRRLACILRRAWYDRGTQRIAVRSGSRYAAP